MLMLLIRRPREAPTVKAHATPSARFSFAINRVFVSAVRLPEPNLSRQMRGHGGSTLRGKLTCTSFPLP
jgi:hypothetical protein